MNTNNITVSRHILNKINLEKPLKLIVILIANINCIVSTMSKRLHFTGDRFTKIMMKLSIIKLALAMITLIVMTVLLFIHLDAFDAITMQFSKWVSSPIICFIMLVIAAKFVGLGIGMSIKDLTFESLKIKLRKYCKQSLRFFYKKKVIPQKA